MPLAPEAIPPLSRTTISLFILLLFFFLSPSFQNVAVAPTRLNISMYVTLRPPLLPSTSFKNVKDFHQNLTVCFLVLSAHVHFPSNTTVIVSFFGVPNFLCVYLLFIFLIFPMEILTFCCAHDFLISS